MSLGKGEADSRPILESWVTLIDKLNKKATFDAPVASFSFLMLR